MFGCVKTCRPPWKTAGLLLLTLVVVWGVFRVCYPPDRMFRGKPEREWIQSLRYNDDAQVEQWRQFGPEGAQVLVRALERSPRPPGAAYRKFYSSLAGVLPSSVMGLLPSPKPQITGGQRMAVAALIARLGKEAEMIAMPVMIRSLSDEDESMRGWAISFFTQGEDEQALLNRLGKKQKSALLPHFLWAAKSNSWSVRNNACIALSYYKDDAATILPTLAVALQGAQPQLQLVAAQAIHAIAPEEEIKLGVVPVLTNVLANPDDQVAYRAAQQLGAVRKQPAESVGALVVAAGSTNSLVAGAAIRALQGFPDQARSIIPALEQIEARSQGGIRRAAAETLARLKQ